METTKPELFKLIDAEFELRPIGAHGEILWCRISAIQAPYTLLREAVAYLEEVTGVAFDGVDITAPVDKRIMAYKGVSIFRSWEGVKVVPR